MSFTVIFEAATMEEKPKLVEAERDRRVTSDLDKYVAVPICVPIQSQMAPGTPAGYQLGWMIGCPGLMDFPDRPEKKVREGFPVAAMSREDVVEDLAALLNFARSQREGKDRLIAALAKPPDAEEASSPQ